MPRTLTLNALEATFGALEQIPPTSAAIGVTDSGVAQYARVLEYGSLAGEKPWPRPGPRTTRAVNPETGEEAVVTLQAPHGFIRAHAREIADVLASHLQESAVWLDSEAAAAHVRAAAQKAAERALELLRGSAPRNSGKLIAALRILDGR